jgi:hypothetical protein
MPVIVFNRCAFSSQSPLRPVGCNPFLLSSNGEVSRRKLMTTPASQRQVGPAPADAARIALQLTHDERSALRLLPMRDRGHLPDDVWWAYYSILDQGLAKSDGNFLISITALGQEVLNSLGEA